MATSHQDLVFSVYAPALVNDDSRPLAIIHGVERALHGLRLDWTISEEGQRVFLPDRDAFVARERKDGGFPLLRNGDVNYRVTLSGWERPAGVSPGGQAQFEVHAKLPLDAVGIAAAAVLENMGDAAHAYWGEATPEGVAAELAQQIRHSVREPHVPPRGLPTLARPEQIRSPEIPRYLGWLNYWSAAAVEALGFPDLPRDVELISRSRRTTTGGWVVQLTEVPLDLDNPAHLDALLRAYNRFPEIGERAAP